MAVMRHSSRSTTEAPLPSPIPTGKGSRSAATETFTQFLDKCLQIPDLIALPPSHLSGTASRHPIPADVDFRSLSADSIARLLVSAKQLGAFRITGHGISADELRSVVREAESVFGNADQPRRMVERIADREEIAWVRDRKSESDQTYRDFCKNMENVAGKMKAIAEKVSEIFYRNEKQQFERRNEVKDWVVRLYRYNHDQDKEQSHSNISPNEITNGNRDRECDDHGLCIYLPLEHSQFYIHSEPTSLSFNAGPETLVVTVGKQLEGFKCVSGEMIFVPDISRTQASFSLQLKVPFSSNFRKNSKIISVADQVFIAVFLCLLYKVVVFIYTCITTT
ncbi:hypothetical protein M0R45_028834 [Rubus argutus]|uniref:Uncharacterized protein n=1 Tax=Rubus argutus TaxID=59490 RepID=A0AAW1W8R4_RUBAR